jgi:acyl-CoA thioester hydrolase
MLFPGDWPRVFWFLDFDSRFMHKKISLVDLEGLPITYRKEIPENYRDEMGHMNVMWYTHLFSQAFDKFGALWAFDWATWKQRGIGSFVLEAHIRYLAEVRVGQHITLRSRALSRSAKRFHYMHFMTIDETGALAATAEQISGHMDMTLRRMSPMAPELCAKFDALVAKQNQLGWEPPVCGSMQP